MIPNDLYGPLEANANYYAILHRRSDGLAWKAGSSVWEALGTSAASTYAIALTPLSAGSKYYRFAFPSGAVGPDEFRWTIYKRAGGAGAENYETDVDVLSDEWNAALAPYDGVLGSGTTINQVVLPAAFNDGSAVGASINVVGFPGRILTAMPSSGIYTVHTPYATSPASGTRFSLGPLTTSASTSDSPGVTTLLARLTTTRADNLDRLDATITSRMASGGSMTVSGYATGMSPAEQVLATPGIKVATYTGGLVRVDLAQPVPRRNQTTVADPNYGDCLQGAWAGAFGVKDNSNPSVLAIKQPDNSAWRTFAVTLDANGEPTVCV